MHFPAVLVPIGKKYEIDHDPSSSPEERGCLGELIERVDSLFTPNKLL